MCGAKEDLARTFTVIKIMLRTDLIPVTVESFDNGVIHAVMEENTKCELLLWQCRQVRRGPQKPFLDSNAKINVTSRPPQPGDRLVIASTKNHHGDMVRCDMWGFKKFYDQHLAAGPLEVDRRPIGEQLLGEKSVKATHEALVPKLVPRARLARARQVKTKFSPALISVVPIVSDLDKELGYDEDILALAVNACGRNRGHSHRRPGQ